MKVKLFLQIYDNLASINPFDVKLFVFLQLYHIKFDLEYSTDLSKSPNNQSPYIIEDNKTIGDSETIIHYLVNKHNIKREKMLSEKQKSIALHIRALLEEKLFRIIYYARLIDDDAWPAFKDHCFAVISESTKKQIISFREHFVKTFGKNPHHIKNEIYAEAAEIFAELDKFVNNNDYVFGDLPHAIDATLYGFLASIVKPPLETKLKTELIKHNKLVDFVVRIDGKLQL